MVKMKKFIGEGLKASGPNLNVLNVLRTLIEDKDCEVYIPYSYQKENKGYIGDPNVLWNPKEQGTPCKVTGIISNKERFNFSLSAVVDVHVLMNNGDGSFNVVPKKVFRNYTVIEDSNLKIEHLFVKLKDLEAYRDLAEAGILRFSNDGIIESGVHNFNSNYVYKIRLNDIPLISLNWAQPYNIGLYEYLVRESWLTQEAQKLRVLIKKYKAEGQVLIADTEESEFYSENSTYIPVSEREDSEASKLVPCVTYDFPELKVDYEFDESAYPNLLRAHSALKEFEKELKSVRFISRCVIMAIESSAKKGSYNWSELQKLPKSTTKKFQIADVEIEGIGTMKLRRTEYIKSV